MSDEVEQDQREFEASAERLEKARQEGRFARSREIGAAAGLLVGGAFLAYGSGPLISGLLVTTRSVFRQVGERHEDAGATGALLSGAAVEVGLALAPLLGGVMVAAVGVSMAQSGFLFAPELVLPKFERLDPFKGFAQLMKLGPAAMRTAMGLLKTVFVGLVVWSALGDTSTLAVQLAGLDVAQTAGHVGRECVRVLISGAAALVLVAAIDYAWQRFDFLRQMKVTREDMKRENKENEGSPEVKQKRRGIQREMAMNRIVKEVPTATVVVTNPTHVSVALRYDPEVDAAPRVVAKGVDGTALFIRRIAREHGVPILENPPLARALNQKVKAGRRISEEFYLAVAEVLAAVYRIAERGRR